ncbi:MAG: PBSX family phage terminase large subunit [Bacteroides sp.]|nr:PBSX family phage terminase large subunit [Bacteroides sp.]
MSSDLIFTPKQSELMGLFKHGRLARLNLLEGSVSSGKTWISLVLWAFWVASMPSDKLYLMSAKSLTTLKRNCLILLQELVGRKNFTFSPSAKEGFLFGRKILLEGANDSRSESKIRGLTLQGAYCDELTQFPEDFFAMLLSRLRVPGAKLIATTNPDRPGHWLKANYMDNPEVGMFRMKFLIDDNTTLDPEYIRAIKKEYSGVFYERFIRGAWVSAEGCIYTDFADHAERFLIDEAPKELAVVTIGFDFGGNGSAHAGVATGITVGFREVVTLDEYYRKEIVSPDRLIGDICDFITRVQRQYRCYDAYFDSAETTLIKGVKLAVQKRGIKVNVHNARKGAVNERIRLYQMLQSTGRYKIVKHCKHTIEAFSTAVWKPNADDVRLDDGSVNIDSLDAQEYSTEPYMKRLIEAGRNYL